MKKAFLFSVFVMLSALLFSQTAVLWNEDFETDASTKWSASSGVWEIGVPSSGPQAAHGGTRCGATVLAGNYPTVADTRLFRIAYFTVPATTENPRLRFWHWFSFSTSDYGTVQIHVQGTPSADWIDISQQYINTGSAVWTYASLDLSSYAGQVIQVAFFFHSEDPWPGNNVSTGWYIDDISVITGPLTFNNPETWENGIGDWHAEAGTWETGSPSKGPSSAHGGERCAATVLDGNYATVVDSRLVSTWFSVPSAGQNPRLRFWHWFSFSTSDYGKVQVRIKGSQQWTDISQQYINTGSAVWTYTSLDLSLYAGQIIQIAFNFHAEDPWPGNNVSTGWYIDDISVVTGQLTFNNPETWENGIGDWSAEAGSWETGSPSAGPSSAHGGTRCAATVLGGNYATVADTRLVSTYYTVPAANQNPRLRFWHWFSFSTSDYGKVQVREKESQEWADLSQQYVNTGSGVWSSPALDLTTFAGKTIQISFYFHAEDPWPGNNISTGWYIDDISIVTGPLTYNNPETWENGIGDWFAESGAWETGNPTSGPMSAHGGSNCAATVLNGKYATVANTRLVSPPITLPSPGSSPSLNFWHWFNFSTADYGIVEIKAEGSQQWTDISQKYENSGGSVWTFVSIDLYKYGGQTVRFAFRLYAEDPWPGGNNSTGWYIDDVEIRGYNGINDKQIRENLLKIYPNPASDKFYIELDILDPQEYEVTLYSASGHAVRTIRIATGERIEIDKGIIPPGLYFVKLKGNKTYSGKIIVE